MIKSLCTVDIYRELIPARKRVQKEIDRNFMETDFAKSYLPVKKDKKSYNL